MMQASNIAVLSDSPRANAHVARGRVALEIEAQAVAGLGARLDHSFAESVEVLLGCKGRVIVTGMGKSGHIARKIAATLASTGTPAHFVHPAEAQHGDLGMISRDDVVIALSHSGESAELVDILPLLKRRGTTLIALTGKPKSSLAREADITLDCGVAREACPLNLAPTASTTAALAMGDALAVTLLEARGFTAEDFAQSHPGGKLGRRLLTHVRDVMRPAEKVPQVACDATLEQAMLSISKGALGMTVVLDGGGEQVGGIFTDRDLRVALATFSAGADFRSAPVAKFMTVSPKTIQADKLAVDAAEMMDRHRISQLIVVDDHNRLLGAFNTLDLMNKGVL
jgi:arabinose-5-phosphate isomerase